MSPGAYRELIKPGHTKVNQAIREMGIIPAVHCCGNCQEIIPDFIEEGNVASSSAQPNATPEEIKAEVHRAIDTLHTKRRG